MSEKIFINGKFVSPAQAVIPVSEPGLLYGWGVFETMRAIGCTIVCLPQHLKRILGAARKLTLAVPYSCSDLSGIIRRAIRINGYQDAVVRLSLYKSAPGVYTVVTVKPYKAYTSLQYQKGFSACVSSLRQDQQYAFAQVKTTSRLLFQLAAQEARKKGCDEAIILNTRGFIAEGARSNIFLVKRKKIMTPALTCGCLPGVTRQLVITLGKKSGYKIDEGKFCLDDLRSADEGFLTNSLIGIMPLVSLQGRDIGKGAAGNITKDLMAQYARRLMKLRLK
ncbi:MAG: aminotransferase class IV [Candidatus Omnitrophota bacterium]|jgi:branched-subunit amino acid aminotransferase/4-amino-4-deoxychorismate lyase